MRSFLFILFICVNAQAQKPKSSEIYLDILPLELQYRFEDSNDQSRTTRQYQAYDLGFQLTDFRAQLQLSQYADSTGNASLKINQSIRELNIGLGYRIFHFYPVAHLEPKIELSSFLVLWTGQTQTEIETTLLSTQNSIQSDEDQLYGAGLNFLFRIGYFLAETDFKYITSKNMSPQQVPVFGFKIGASFLL